MKITYFIMIIACGLSMAYAQSSKEASTEVSSPGIAEEDSSVLKVKVSDLPGRSTSRAIVIKKAKNDVELRDEQMKYIESLEGNYQVQPGGDVFMLSDGRVLQTVWLENMADDDDQPSIYFNITKVCKNVEDFKDKLFKEKVERVLKQGPPPRTIIIVPADKKAEIRATWKDCPMKKKLLAAPETEEEADKISAKEAAKKVK